MTLSKETLQKFIANYSTPFHPLTDNPWEQSYNQGSAEVLQALQSTFLNAPFDSTGYLESDDLIDQCIQQAKVNLAKMKPLIAQMKSLSKEDSDKWKQQLQAISVPGFPIF